MISSIKINESIDFVRFHSLTNIGHKVETKYESHSMYLEIDSTMLTNI